MSNLTIENKKIICEKCKKETLIMKGCNSKFCPDCKRDNFIELLIKN